MPNTKSAIRRVRRVAKQTAVNKLRKSKYRSAIKTMENLIKRSEKDKIKKFFPQFQSILMQVAKSGVTPVSSCAPPSENRKPVIISSKINNAP